MALSIETYALCKKFAKDYCDSHASTLTEEQAVQAVANYFNENPNAIVTNEELDGILANYLTEHQSLEGYATESWVENKNYLTTHQDLSEYAKTTEVITTVNTAISDLIDGAPETLDTLKELADNFNGVATQTWINSQGFITEHYTVTVDI